jgi:hypothetical protein
MREALTDERLDDMARRMDAGFARVDADLREITNRLDAMQRAQLQSTIAITTTMLTGFVAVFTTIVIGG